jgi:hypothetical protein
MGILGINEGVGELRNTLNQVGEQEGQISICFQIGDGFPGFSGQQSSTKSLFFIEKMTGNRI